MPQTRVLQRAGKLFRRYGITPEQFDDMARYGCNICHRDRCVSGRNLSVDHCHETGKVRGTLCGPCNRGIGLFGDDPSRLRLAAEYLERTS
jgi:hypothetical protein